MNHLFIRLYLDDDVPVVLAPILQSQGFDVLTTHEARRLQSKDPNQLAFATTQQRTIATHNRVHYERLAREYYETGQTHYGILIVIQRPVYDMARRVLEFLNHVTADEMVNQVRYL